MALTSSVRSRKMRPVGSPGPFRPWNIRVAAISMNFRTFVMYASTPASSSNYTPTRHQYKSQRILPVGGCGGERRHLFQFLEFVFPVVVIEGAAEEDDLRSDDVCAREVGLFSAVCVHLVQRVLALVPTRIPNDATKREITRLMGEVCLPTLFPFFCRAGGDYMVGGGTAASMTNAEFRETANKGEKLKSWGEKR